MHDDAHLEDAHHPEINYFGIFLVLCVCTALSVVFDIVPMNHKIVAVLVLAVAVAKAQYVMRYFMHLKFEGLWKYVLLLPTAILACGLPLALAPDIALHYYTPEHPAMQADWVPPDHGHGHSGGHGGGEASEPHHGGESAAGETGGKDHHNH